MGLYGGERMKRVFRDTLPVLVGYLFLGAGFGILLVQNGHSAIWAFFMSTFIYAGSGQYLAVDLMAECAGLFSAFIATLLVNARHLFYGISLLDTYRDAGMAKPYMIFALTDETYSLVTQNQPPEGMSRTKYCFLVSALDHSYWIVGCVLGALAGTYIPINYKGVEFVLTALFVTLFTEQWCAREDHTPAILGLTATAVCLLLFGRQYFLIPAMMIIAVSLTVLNKLSRKRRPKRRDP